MTVRHHAVRVPATTANIGPGFDAFGAAVSRHLFARSRDRHEQGDRVVTRGEGAGEVAAGDDNLIWRCLVRFCDTFEVAVPDVAVEVDNEVPLERGLGSSSAAIVAGLALARAVTEAAVGDLQLVELATEIEGHPDNVAPAVLGGFVACVPDVTGRLVTRRAQPAPRLRPVALVPTSRQLTSEARDVLPTSFDRRDMAVQAARAGHVVGGMLGAWPVAAAASGDVLHEPARLEVMGATGAVVGALRSLGVHAWLSGAGPTAAAAVARGEDGQLATCRRVGDEHGFEVLVLDWDLSGTVACPRGGCAVTGGQTCSHGPSRTV
ncbi:MAG: homoserine kinase [Actinobacteria bacterium]|nr:homoserine kinase [Actinomycetota bacterium]